MFSNKTGGTKTSDKLIFFCRMTSCPNICVDALLEASVKHSPHFDWVVAHIGFVQTKVLMRLCNNVSVCTIVEVQFSVL